MITNDTSGNASYVRLSPNIIYSDDDVVVIGPPENTGIPFDVLEMHMKEEKTQV